MKTFFSVVGAVALLLVLVAALTFSIACQTDAAKKAQVRVESYGPVTVTEKGYQSSGAEAHVRILHTQNSKGTKINFHDVYGFPQGDVAEGTIVNLTVNWFGYPVVKEILYAPVIQE